MHLTQQAFKKYLRPEVFRDPVYGYIYLEYEIIEKLINTNVFQRLRRIKQLSGANIVFHGAEHSRFTHSLGVYELARRFLAITNLKQHFNKNEELLLLVSALLHDVGHNAYSHSFETFFNFNHEAQGANIIKNNPEISSLLDSIGPNFKNNVANIILKTNQFPLIEQILTSQIDIDRMDYLERDSYFTGAIYGHIDSERIMRSMVIETNPKTNHKCIAFKQSGIYAIENYLINRYHMFWQVYYHAKARAYTTILEKIFNRLCDLLKDNYPFDNYVKTFQNFVSNPNNLDRYLAIDDYYINGLVLHLQHHPDYFLNSLCQDFLKRRLWHYLDDNEKNKIQIESIKQYYEKKSKEHLKYYTAHSTVGQSAYRESGKKFGEKILIKNQNELKSLKEESPIIKSLIKSSQKTDNKFFYRPFKNT